MAPEETILQTQEDYESIPAGNDTPVYQDIDAVEFDEGWTGLTCPFSETEIAKAMHENYYPVTQFGTINDKIEPKTSKRIPGRLVVINWQLFPNRDGKLLVGGEPLLARTKVHEKIWRDRARAKLAAATNMAAGTSKPGVTDPQSDAIRVVHDNPGHFEAGQDARPLIYSDKRSLTPAE